jgi:methionine aminopeptidase
MTRKDYIRAAAIVREVRRHVADKVRQGLTVNAECVVMQAFIDLFKGDNVRFDEGRFAYACEDTPPSTYRETESFVKGC